MHLKTLVLLLCLASGRARAQTLIEAHPRTQGQLRAEATPRTGEPWIAIVGDSSVTGAATAPVYTADWWALFAQAFSFIFLEPERTELQASLAQYPDPQAFGITAPVEPLTRVLFSQAEKDEAEANGTFGHLNWDAKIAIRLDTPEYGFGYMVGRALGVQPARIINTGQDGRQVTTTAHQFERIFEVGAPQLPPLVLVSYVANDFCHPDYFTHPVNEFRAEFSRNVKSQLDAIRKFPPASGGTEVLVLAPLDVAAIMTNPDLLAQVIPFQGGSLTCGELRRGVDPERGRLVTAMSNTLLNECRGVLTPVADQAAHIARIRDLQDIQFQTWRQAIAEFNASAPAGLKIKFASSVRRIQFQKGDLANDCFHPSVRGHARIAHQLLDHELHRWIKAEASPAIPLTDAN